MFYTQEQMKSALRKLDEVKKKDFCPQPRLDADGNSEWKNEVRGVAVPYGTHGSAFLQVDPESGEIRCALCAGEVKYTAAPKSAVARAKGNRTDFVSVDVVSK